MSKQFCARAYIRFKGDIYKMCNIFEGQFFFQGDLYQKSLPLRAIYSIMCTHFQTYSFRLGLFETLVILATCFSWSSIKSQKSIHVRIGLYTLSRLRFFVVRSP